MLPYVVFAKCQYNFVCWAIPICTLSDFLNPMYHVISSFPAFSFLPLQFPYHTMSLSNTVTVSSHRKQTTRASAQRALRALPRPLVIDTSRDHNLINPPNKPQFPPQVILHGKPHDGHSLGHSGTINCILLPATASTTRLIDEPMNLEASAIAILTSFVCELLPPPARVRTDLVYFFHTSKRGCSLFV